MTHDTHKGTVRVSLPMMHHELWTDGSSFMFRKERPHHWLQRAALWVLKKLRCERIYNHVEVRYTNIDCDALWQAVERQVFEIRHVWCLNRLTIIVGGGENYHRFMSEVYDQVPFKIEMRQEIARSTPHGPRYKFLDFDVVFLPYWDGLLVLPGEYRER